MLWFGLKNVEYSGELRDFNTPLFKLLFSASALATQAWIIYEFLNEQKANGRNLTTSLGLLKPKTKTANKESTNKKRKNAGMCWYVYIKACLWTSIVMIWLFCS